MNDMDIRTTTVQDKPALLRLHGEAFGDEEGDSVAQLVDALLDVRPAQPAVSLVAMVGGEYVGHVLLTPVQLEPTSDYQGYILAPLAIAPHYQRRGIGTALTQRGLAILKSQDVSFVLVLGDPSYYTRMGFHQHHRFKAPHKLPYPEAWMATELKDGVLQNACGIVHCVAPLNAPEYW